MMVVSFSVMFGPFQVLHASCLAASIWLPSVVIGYPCFSVAQVSMKCQVSEYSYICYGLDDHILILHYCMQILQSDYSRVLSYLMNLWRLGHSAFHNFRLCVHDSPSYGPHFKQCIGHASLWHLTLHSIVVFQYPEHCCILGSLETLCTVFWADGMISFFPLVSYTKVFLTIFKTIGHKNASWYTYGIERGGEVVNVFHHTSSSCSTALPTKSLGLFVPHGLHSWVHLNIWSSGAPSSRAIVWTWLTEWQWLGFDTDCYHQKQ